YAALLQGVYRTRHWRYGAHLVFALYAHSFLLLIFVIEAKLPIVLATVLSIWAVVYYALSLKRTYGGTWPRNDCAWHFSRHTVLPSVHRNCCASDYRAAIHLTAAQLPADLFCHPDRDDKSRPLLAVQGRSRTSGF